MKTLFFKMGRIFGQILNHRRYTDMRRCAGKYVQYQQPLVECRLKPREVLLYTRTSEGLRTDRKARHAQCCSGCSVIGTLALCWWEMQNGAAPLRSGLAVFHKIKNKLTGWF